MRPSGSSTYSGDRRVDFLKRCVGCIAQARRRVGMLLFKVSEDKASCLFGVFHEPEETWGELQRDSLLDFRRRMLMPERSTRKPEEFGSSLWSDIPEPGTV